MKELSRGEIYFINFPYTFDENYREGKKKFVLILQDGEPFNGYDTVVVLLITRDPSSKGYDTNVTIELGTTKLNRESYIICAQPYTVEKSLFEEDNVWCAGNLYNIEGKMDEVDESLVIGLCIGRQYE